MMEVLQQILHRLGPIGLEDFGLDPSCRSLSKAGTGASAPSLCTYTADTELDGLPDDIKLSVYRITQEAITNAVRHGQPGHVAVTLQRGPADLALEIRDDGQGSPPPDSAAGKTGGFGRLGMEERVLALGGSLDIRPAPGRGTLVSVSFPLPGLGAAPEEALQRLCEIETYLIILDLSLPNMGGIVLTRRIRSARPTRASSPSACTATRYSPPRPCAPAPSAT